MVFSLVARLVASPLIKILLLVIIQWYKNRSYTEKVKYPLFPSLAWPFISLSVLWNSTIRWGFPFQDNPKKPKMDSDFCDCSAMERIQPLYKRNMVMKFSLQQSSENLSYLPGQQVVNGSCSNLRTYGKSVVAVVGNSAVLTALWTVTSVSGGFRSNVSTGLASVSWLNNSSMFPSILAQRFSQPCCLPVLQRFWKIIMIM